MGPKSTGDVLWMRVCTNIDIFVSVEFMANLFVTYFSLSMNHGNCDTAVDMLKAQFRDSDGGVGEVTQAWYSIWGDVVSYFRYPSLDTFVLK